jgi:hypothetical protein
MAGVERSSTVVGSARVLVVDDDTSFLAVLRES